MDRTQQTFTIRGSFLHLVTKWSNMVLWWYYHKTTTRVYLKKLGPSKGQFTVSRQLRVAPCHERGWGDLHQLWRNGQKILNFQATSVSFSMFSLMTWPNGYLNFLKYWRSDLINKKEVIFCNCSFFEVMAILSAHSYPEQYYQTALYLIALPRICSNNTGYF